MAGRRHHGYTVGIDSLSPACLLIRVQPKDRLSSGMHKTIILLLLLTSQVALAGDIGNNNSYSADYLRTLSRNASTETDAAFYNPAGLTALSDGLYVQLNNQMWDVLIDIDWREQIYKSRAGAAFIPSAAIVYTTQPFAFFLTYGPKAINGSANIEPTHPYLTQAAEQQLIDLIGSDDPDTLALLETKRADLELAYLSGGITTGISYAPFDFLSLTAGFGFNFLQASMDVDAEYQFLTTEPTMLRIDAVGTGTGFSYQAGIHLAPTQDIDIAFNYISATAITLNWDKKEDSTDLLPEEQRRDIPASLTAGASYRFLDDFEVTSSFTHYLNQQADWGENPEDQTPVMSKYRNGIDLGFSFQYTYENSWAVSAGYNRSWSGATAESRNLLETGLDANSFTAGTRYPITDSLSVSAAITAIAFSPAKNADEDIGYTAFTWGGGFGLTWKAL